MLQSGTGWVILAAGNLVILSTNSSLLYRDSNTLIDIVQGGSLTLRTLWLSDLGNDVKIVD